MSQSDLLIVCGTGVVCDYLTGPIGWPYDFFKWSAFAALFRVKVLFLGVGVGPIYHPLSRWFLKRSLGLAAPQLPGRSIAAVSGGNWI
ncbi:MAG: polysaccharide pyruvyl transferase family protein [Methylocapsa sp.]|nr:polysaccharide pyruvyl transferase family protein [Methylocapsa sp.]